jgi:hypothetical protein
MLLLRLGLAILAIAVPISVAVSRRALFILVPVGASLVLVAGLLLSDHPIRRRIGDTLLSPAGLCGLGLIAWAALSIVWSPVGIGGAERLAKTAGTMLLVVVTAAFLPERTRTSNLNLFPLGILGSVALTLYIALGGAMPPSLQPADNTMERAVVTLVVLVWPALGAMAIRDRWMPAVVVVLAVMFAAMAAWSSGALAALALASIAFAVATGNPERMGRIIGNIVAALFLLGPAVPFVVALVLKLVTALAGDRLPDVVTVLESARVWADVVVASPLRLLTGHGIDMTAVAPTIGFLPPLTPGSLLFEIWYDFGVVGAVLAALLARSAFNVIGHLSPIVAPFLLAELVAVLTIAFCGLDTTQLWWITLLGVAALAFAVVVRGQYRTTRPVARLEPQIAPLPR